MRTQFKILHLFYERELLFLIEVMFEGYLLSFYTILCVFEALLKCVRHCYQNLLN